MRKQRGRARSKRKRISRRSEAARDRALHALNLMRMKSESLARAAREANSSARTILRYTRTAIIKQPNGRYRAKPFDRLRRTMFFPGETGHFPITIHRSTTASMIARYWVAVERLRLTGDQSILDEFRGKSVKVGKDQFPFIVDAKILKRLALAGVTFENIYATNY